MSPSQMSSRLSAPPASVSAMSRPCVPYDPQYGGQLLLIPEDIEHYASGTSMPVSADAATLPNRSQQ
jgi:hypothetical protein